MKKELLREMDVYQPVKKNNENNKNMKRKVD